jgi:hypothetical protein
MVDVFLQFWVHDWAVPNFHATTVGTVTFYLDTFRGFLYMWK